MDRFSNQSERSQPIRNKENWSLSRWVQPNRLAHADSTIECVYWPHGSVFRRRGCVFQTDPSVILRNSDWEGCLHRMMWDPELPETIRKTIALITDRLLSAQIGSGSVFENRSAGNSTVWALWSWPEPIHTVGWCSCAIQGALECLKTGFHRLFSVSDLFFQNRSTEMVFAEPFEIFFSMSIGFLESSENSTQKLYFLC